MIHLLDFKMINYFFNYFLANCLRILLLTFLYVPMPGHCDPIPENTNQIGLFMPEYSWMSLGGFSDVLDSTIVYPLNRWPVIFSE